MSLAEVEKEALALRKPSERSSPVSLLRTLSPADPDLRRRSVERDAHWTADARRDFPRRIRPPRCARCAADEGGYHPPFSKMSRAFCAVTTRRPAGRDEFLDEFQTAVQAAAANPLRFHPSSGTSAERT